MQLLTIPVLQSDNQVSCLISPRVHQVLTLQKHSAFSGSICSNQVSEKAAHLAYSIRINGIQQSKQISIEAEKNRYEFLRKYKLLKGSPSVSSDPTSGQNTSRSNGSSNVDNGLCSFKDIRCKVKHHRPLGRIIKTIRLNSDSSEQTLRNRYKKSKTQQSDINPEQRYFDETSTKLKYKKILDHLDQIRTIVSHPSPRDSMASSNNVAIEQSHIIQRGRDLYQDIVNEKTEDNRIISQAEIEEIKMAHSIYRTPDNFNRKKKEFGETSINFQRNCENKIIINTEPKVHHKLQFNDEEEDDFIQSQQRYQAFNGCFKKVSKRNETTSKCCKQTSCIPNCQENAAQFVKNRFSFLKTANKKENMLPQTPRVQGFQWQRTYT